MACDFAHVPERLHRNNRPTASIFEVGEEVYRRCTKEEIENPFKSISICELSVNRQGTEENRISLPEDVLVNITSREVPHILAKEICVLVIRDLNPATQTYNKDFFEVKDNRTYTANMTLVHDPHECMYPHSLFRITVDDDVITFANYEDTIKRLKQLRTLLKSELAAMIVQRQITQYLS